MARIKEAFVKDLLKQLTAEDISFSRLVELLNEEANRKVVIGIALGAAGVSGEEVRIALEKVANAGINVDLCIMDDKIETANIAPPPIPDIKLLDANVPLCPKHENQPWSKGYRNELNRHKGKRKK